MKPKKLGNLYQITYRCPNYPKLINERFPSLELANLRIAQIELERKMGTLLPPPELVDPERQHSLYRETITVRQLMEEYVEMYGLSHWGEATLSCNQHRIDDYIIPYIGDIPVKMLTTHRLEKFYRQLLSEPAVKMKGREQEERTISPSVVEKVHAVIRSALNQAIRWDYLQGNNPAMAVELPRYKKGKRDAWTDQEAYNALCLCTDPILALCMSLALGCSMRIGEILGLTWDCVHIEPELVEADEAYLIVDKELRRSHKKSIAKLREQGRDDIYFTFPAWKQTESTTVLVLKAPKTESSVRSIYLPQTVVQALLEQKAVQESYKRDLGSEYQDYNLVVAQENGRPHEERQIAEKLNKLIRENNLRPVVFHSLRHSSTSLKLKLSGGDIKTVQKDTGHSQSRMVTDVYSHSFDEDRKHLARKVDKLFFAQSQQKEPQKPAADPSTEEAMKMLQSNPEMAQAFLQMAQLFKKNP